jgi:hypothetical protein
VRACARAGGSRARMRARGQGGSRTRKPETRDVRTDTVRARRLRDMFGTSVRGAWVRSVRGRPTAWRCCKWQRGESELLGRCTRTVSVRRLGVFFHVVLLIGIGVSGVPTLVEPSEWPGLTWTPLSDLQRRARSRSSQYHSSEGWTSMATRVVRITLVKAGERLATWVHAWSSSRLRTYAVHAGGRIAAGRRAGGTRG